jgi:hypothetical protein
MSIAVDNRQVVLLKSLRTNNRFYALVRPESGFKNADAIEEFPADVLLGIAYPCLEDGLNDFAVIRTTFETIEVFADDEDLRQEMMGIIADARGNLVRRLQELRDRIVSGQAHFLGTELQEFKDHVVHMATRGTIRRNLDNMMKVDVFESVSKAEMVAGAGMAEPMYRYEFLPQHPLAIVEKLPPRVFIGRLLDDVLDAVTTDSNYGGKYRFDKDVFQKFIAVMFVNYATTDPMFYGTSREDYGVSSEKDMQTTPLYQAVARALREIEREVRREPLPEGAQAEEEDLSSLFQQPVGAFDLIDALPEAGHTVDIPFGAAERMLEEPLTLLADAVRLLKNVDHPHAPEIRRMAATAGHQLFQSLQELKIISPLASDPLADSED